MVNYIEIKMKVASAEKREILVAELAGMGFEAFEENSDVLSGYIPESDFNKDNVKGLLHRYHIDYSTSVIEQKNWNEAWETSFEPVQFSDFCYIRADFHEPQNGFMHEIVITPKMSFGTGHHATTYLMIETMKDIDFRDKSVLDFGTGTGVLAILAEKMGAKKVEAVDNDDWSIESATENLKNNHAEKVVLFKADLLDRKILYDVILCNINKNAILKLLISLEKHISTTGIIVLGGLLTDDCSDVVEAATAAGLKFVDKNERSGWASLVFVSGKD